MRKNEGRHSVGKDPAKREREAKGLKGGKKGSEKRQEN